MKVLLLILLFAGSSVFAQTPDSVQVSKNGNSIFLELGGNAFMLSLNYERIFVTESPFSFTGRLGLGLFPYELGLFGGESKYTGVVPVSFGVLYGRKFSLEAGLGASVAWFDGDIFGNSSGPIKWFNGLLGMRYQAPGGFLFRLGFTPVINFQDICQDSECQEIKKRLHVWPFFGISLGTSFP